MAKKSGSNRTLTPHQLPTGKWQVSLGIHENPEGKKTWKRRYFASRAEAQDFCSAERARIKAHGAMTANTDGAMVSQWLALNDQLLDAGAGSLLEVGKRILADIKAIRKSGSAGECLDAFLVTRAPSIYTDDLRVRCGRFVDWYGADRRMSEITRDVMMGYWDHLKTRSAAKNKNKIGATDRRTISAWMGWAADTEEGGWIAANPCTRSRRKGVKKDKAEVVILTPAQASKLLKSATEEGDMVTLSYLAISLFAGVRPSEFTKKYKGEDRKSLTWEDIKSDHIVIPSDMAKTGTGRTIPISPTLRAWLDYISDNSEDFLTGAILKTGQKGGGWRKHWEAFLSANWGHVWHADQLRHSYGSYTLASTQNADETCLKMGNSRQILLAHYWDWKTLGSDSNQYFALTPKSILKNTNKKLAIVG
jgi:hypothetical protein